MTEKELKKGNQVRSELIRWRRIKEAFSQTTTIDGPFSWVIGEEIINPSDFPTFGMGKRIMEMVLAEVELKLKILEERFRRIGTPLHCYAVTKGVQ